MGRPALLPAYLIDPCVLEQPCKFCPYCGNVLNSTGRVVLFMPPLHAMLCVNCERHFGRTMLKYEMDLLCLTLKEDS